MDIVLEECDVTVFWLEIIKEKCCIQNDMVDKAMKEGNELTALFVTIFKNTKLRMNKK